DMLYVSGQGPFGPEKEVLGGDFKGQVRVTLDNIERVAAAAGTSLSNAVRLGVYVSSLNHFAELNEVFDEYFTAPYPARTTINADLRRFDVEIDAVIYVPAGSRG